MTKVIIPDWLKLPLMNVKLATVSDVPQELRDKAHQQLLDAINLRIELARQDDRRAK